MNILVTGGTGLLGYALRNNINTNDNFIFIGSKDYDLTDFNETKNVS